VNYQLLVNKKKLKGLRPARKGPKNVFLVLCYVLCDACFFERISWCFFFCTDHDVINAIKSIKVKKLTVRLGELLTHQKQSMVNSPKYYRIYWKSLKTNSIGNGHRILSYDRAREEVFLLNKMYSGFIYHWVQ